MPNVIMRSVVALILIGFSAAAVAAPGDTDPTFGTQGATTTPPTLAISTPTSIVSDSGGRIYVLVSTTVPDIPGIPQPPPGSGMPADQILRFTRDGILDPGFGNNGVLDLPFPQITPSSGGGIVPMGLALDEAHQQFLVSGSLETLGTYGLSPMQETVSRINFDGTADPGFGTDGTATISSVEFLEGDAVDLLPDGHILVAGDTQFIDGTIYVTRLNSDGTLDTTFGNAGTATLSASNSLPSMVAAITHDAAGSIYLCGSQRSDPLVVGGTSPAPTGIIVGRLSENGAPVAGFDPSGRREIDFGGNPACLTIQPHDDGSFALAAFEPGTLTIASVTPSGVLDPRFNGTGLQSGPLSSTYFGQFSTAFGAIPSALTQSDGKLVLGIAGGGQLYAPEGDVSQEAGIVLTRVAGSPELQTSSSSSSSDDGSGKSGSGGGASGAGALAMLAVMAAVRRRRRAQAV